MAKTRTATKSLPEKVSRLIECDSAPRKAKAKVRKPKSTVVKPKVKAKAKAAPKTGSTRSRSTAARHKAKATSRSKPPAPRPEAHEAEVNDNVTSEPVFYAGGSSTNFLDLPAELRNEIYTHALIGDYSHNEINDIIGTFGNLLPSIKEPALLATSRQVRSEARSIWQGQTTTVITGSSPAVKYLRSLSSDELRTLRVLYIQLGNQAEQGFAKEHARERMKHLHGEFGPRGLSRHTIHFQVKSQGRTVWANLRGLKRLP